MQKLKRSIVVKCIAVFMFVVFTISAFICGLGSFYCLSNDLYTLNTNDAEETILSRIGNDCLNLIHGNIHFNSIDNSIKIVKWGSDPELYFDYIITDEAENVVSKSSFNYISEYIKVMERGVEINTFDDYESGIVNTSQTKTINIKIMIKQFPKGSTPSMVYNAFMLLYNNRFNVIYLTLILLVVSILLFCFLVSAFGHSKGTNEIKTGFFEKIPFDILTLITSGIFVLLCLLFVVIFDSFIDVYILINVAKSKLIFGFIIEIICSALILLTALFWCRCLSVKIKTKSVFKDMLVYKILVKLFYLLKKAFRLFSVLILKIPLIWKTVLIIASLSLVEMITLIIHGNGELAIVWFLEKIVIVPVVLLIAVNLKKLQYGGDALANGNFNHKINTDFMFLEFKKHAENLNSIGIGMNKAVEAKMKSERFKTELITNVSHDIKTPLTSIINYVELLKTVELDNDVAEEYVSVISRQSDRLKKLIEDLVEASKASSGSLAVNLKPCDIGIIISQTVGEYQDKLKTNGLDLIVKVPENQIKILADGRHLWRVFDNLLNNICKHALNGSRVYLTLEQVQEFAVISFKNISKYELDISSDELMERFVRGDKSRNTEGSGLGLSIAKSLTEIQGGKFALKIDGDLFKAILKFKIF